MWYNKGRVEKKISFKFNELHKGKLLEKSYVGEIYIKEILESWNEIISNKIIDPELFGVLIDMRKATLMFSIKDVDRLMKFATKTNSFAKFRFAILTETPKHVVFSVIAGKSNSNFSIAPFTTREAALHWIFKINEEYSNIMD